MMPSDTYIDVAVALPVHNTFTYGVPESFVSFVAVGKRVLVPFGQRRVTGYILGYSDTDPDKDLKLILDVLDDSPLFVPSMVPFFQWISDYYKHPLGEVIKTALPGGLTIYDVATIAIADRGYQALQQDSATPVEKQILQCLKSGPCRQKDLSKKINQSIPAALIQSLERRGRITKSRELGGGKTKVRTQRYVTLAGTDLSTTARSPARQKILETLKAHCEISVKELKAYVPSAP
ncbi:MAG: primosomal protein N', partial [Desulfobacterales bacterium]